MHQREKNYNRNNKCILLVTCVHNMLKKIKIFYRINRLHRIEITYTKVCDYILRVSITLIIYMYVFPINVLLEHQFHTILLSLTHVGFVFERELTVITSAMEMCGPLAVERAIWCPAFLCSSEPLKSFLYDGGVFTVIIRVHLHVRRAYVHLVARAL